MIREVWRAGIVEGNSPILVIPANAGLQGQRARSERFWIPAFAGMTEFGFRLREPTGTAWSDAAMTLAAYLPLVGRSGVAPSRSSSEAVAHRGARRWGGGLSRASGEAVPQCLTPPRRRLWRRRPSPSRGGMEQEATPRFCPLPRTTLRTIFRTRRGLPCGD